MANRTKLLFVITKSNWGGAQRYVYDLATNLNAGYDVLVATGGNGILLERLRGKSVRTGSLAYLGRDIRAFTDLKALVELYRLFRRERPDIVHLNSSKAGALGAFAARLARVPRIVFTMHGWPFNEPVSRASKAFRWLASLVTLLLSDETITASHFDSMHAPLSLKTTTIHHGVTEPVFLSREEARQRILHGRNISAVPLLIGTIAELHKNKGIDLLIDAMPEVKDASLVVIAEGEERAALERQIARLRLTDRVFLAGFIFNAASLLKAFDIFVLPSRTEALGYVLIEAGFAEVPVIATMVGGIPEVVDDGLSGVLVPGYDSAAIAEALNEMSRNPNTRKHYAERLKEKVARAFSLQGMIKKTIEVYGPQATATISDTDASRADRP